MFQPGYLWRSIFLTRVISFFIQDVLAGGLTEVELQQQEAMTEDSLSNDEYECVSPDDISLPPLAETPESIIIQSDIEDGFCFSRHSAHVSQYSHHSHHYHTLSEHGGSGTATGKQQTESRQTDGGPTPPTSFHSSTRFVTHWVTIQPLYVTVLVRGMIFKIFYTELGNSIIYWTGFAIWGKTGQNTVVDRRFPCYSNCIPSIPKYYSNIISQHCSAWLLFILKFKEVLKHYWCLIPCPSNG